MVNRKSDAIQQQYLIQDLSNTLHYLGEVIDFLERVVAALNTPEYDSRYDTSTRYRVLRHLNLVEAQSWEIALLWQQIRTRESRLS